MEHIQVRFISLLEDAANSFEQLETAVNRALREVSADAVDDIRLLPVEREVLDEHDDPSCEMDQIAFIRYRKETLPE